MRITEKSVEGVTVLAIAGKLDTHTSDEAQNRMIGLIDGGVEKLVLDLEALEYISSIGFRALLLAAKRLQSEDGGLRICNITGNVKEVFNMRLAEDQFLKKALQEFIQRNVFTRGVNSYIAAYNQGDIEEALARHEALTHELKQVTFQSPDRGMFFEEFDARQERREVTAQSGHEDVFSTGIRDLDESIHGGLRRGEVGLFFGDAKAGKSIGLIHMGFACTRQRAGRVLHFVHEGGRKQTEDRYDARFAEYNYYAMRSYNLDPYIEKGLRQEYSQLGGWLCVQGMMDDWEYTVPDLEGVMQEMEARGFVADMLVVDYADLLAPRKTLDGKYAQQESVYRDLKRLAEKAYRGRGVAIWTASQIRRPDRMKKSGNPLDNDPTYVLKGTELADSYAKIRIVDIAISINEIFFC